MADIFVSYAREDEARIEPLVRALEERGWSVFWDRQIPAGQTWRTYIGKALADARCVIVAWSRHSVASGWVSEEADDGRQRGVLVPMLLDLVDVPIGFRSIQAADLSQWQPGRDSPRFEQLLRDIGVVLGSTTRAAEPIAASKRASAEIETRPEPAKHAQPVSVRNAALVAVTLLVAGGGGYLLYRSTGSSEVSAAADTFQLYQNTRLRFAISYPTGILSPQGDSVDGTSQRFASKDGRAFLVIAALAGRTLADLQERYDRQSRGASDENPTRVVTYKAKGKDWFVVSGYERGRIWYEKTIASPDAMIWFRLEYDESQRKLFDPLIGTIQRSFAILPASR